MSLMKASAMPNAILLGQGHVAQQLNKLATMASERWGGGMTQEAKQVRAQLQPSSALGCFERSGAGGRKQLRG